jgi:hypothetical protein
MARSCPFLLRSRAVLQPIPELEEAIVVPIRGNEGRLPPPRVPCAASASDAIGNLAVPFAACYLGNRLVLLGLYVRAWRHVREARPTIVVYLIIVGLVRRCGQDASRRHQPRADGVTHVGEHRQVGRLHCELPLATRNA